MPPLVNSISPSASLDTQKLQERAINVREHIVRMSTDGGCFIGASLSAVETLVYLYDRFLNIPSTKDRGRDYFFLSKGHDVPALYGTFVEMGVLEKDRLENHLSPNDHLYWHPNRNIPFVEFHSGSLGHLLSVAVGIALDCKREGTGNRIVVVLGDGELNEGSNWEALLVASAYGLDNLFLVVDRNGFQANGKTETILPLEPLAQKFESFGAKCVTTDGHSFEALEESISQFPFHRNGPSVLIAETVRGKGLPSIEGRADRWFCNFSHQEVEELLVELHGKGGADLQSAPLMVR